MKNASSDAVVPFSSSLGHSRSVLNHLSRNANQLRRYIISITPFQMVSCASPLVVRIRTDGEFGTETFNRLPSALRRPTVRREIRDFGASDRAHILDNHHGQWTLDTLSPMNRHILNRKTNSEIMKIEQFPVKHRHGIARVET